MTLVLDRVSKIVGPQTHLADISLTLEPGSLNVLLGATLSGKTSLMRLMAGLDAPTSGRILVEGRDVTGWPVKKRNVAMVYQQFINYPALSVFENIASPLRVAGTPKAEIESRVRDAARLLRLEPYLKRTPLQLSGGQQQRTAIARALVKRASLVLMDEPLANLDYKLREELREELPKLFEASGAVFVYATTDPAEALLLGGSTATLHQGRVTQFGPAAQVYRRPQDLISAQVFSDPPLNVLPATKRSGRIAVEGLAEIAAAGSLAHVADGPCTLGFRAHHLSLDPLPGAALAIPAEVSVAEITGSESYVHVEAAGHRLIALAPGVREHPPGERLTAWLDPGHLFLFGADGRLASAPTLSEAA